MRKTNVDVESHTATTEIYESDVITFPFSSTSGESDCVTSAGHKTSEMRSDQMLDEECLSCVDLSNWSPTRTCAMTAGTLRTWRYHASSAQLDVKERTTSMYAC